MLITLVYEVVIGITWIANGLFYGFNLAVVGYITSFLLVSQGIIIFILFVPLSNQVIDDMNFILAFAFEFSFSKVREAYKKWWRRRIKSITVL